MSKRFEDKVVIVTGSGSGIGETTAIRFAEEGAKVIIADINPETGKKISNDIKGKSGKSFFVETDVSNLDSVKIWLKKQLKVLDHRMY